MKKIKRILSLLMAFLLCASILVGCGKDDDDNNDDGTRVVDTSVAEDGSKLNLPSLDYDGAEVHVVVRTDVLQFFEPTDEFGDVIKNGVFERNTMVEELLDVKLVHSHMEGTAKGADAFCNAIRTSAMTGGPYDIVSPTQSFGNTLVAEGIYVDLLGLEYIDTNENYWLDGYNEQAMINSKLYTAISDYDLSAIANIQVIYMNKQYLEIFGDYIENPYTLVKEGKWTLEKMIEICKQVTVDVDNNGNYDDNDQYGFTAAAYHVPGFATALGVNLVTKDGDDYYFTVADDRSIDAFDRLKTAFDGNYFRYILNGVQCPSFDSGKAMFNTGNVGSATIYKTTSLDYGILIYPKLNEEDEYRSGCAGLPILAITTGLSADKLERASAALQALSYYSHTIAVPAYFETCLKGQAAQDLESYEMLERIRVSGFYDIGLLYSRSLTDLYHAYRLAYEKGVNIATWWAGEETRLNAALNTFLSDFQQ